MHLRNLICITGLFILASIGSAQATAQTRTGKQVPVKERADPQTQVSDAKIKYTPDAEMLKELRKTISIVESKRDWAKFNRQRPITNKNRTRSAYLAGFKIEDDIDNLLEVIVVSDAGTNKFYEIRGFAFPRPMENLVWQSNEVLVFDQWLNPNRGGRYAVNLKTKKLVAFGFIEYL